MCVCVCVFGNSSAIINFKSFVMQRISVTSTSTSCGRRRRWSIAAFVYKGQKALRPQRKQWTADKHHSFGWRYARGASAPKHRLLGQFFGTNVSGCAVIATQPMPQLKIKLEPKPKPPYKVFLVFFIAYRLSLIELYIQHTTVLWFVICGLFIFLFRLVKAAHKTQIEDLYMNNEQKIM